MRARTRRPRPERRRRTDEDGRATIIEERLDPDGGHSANARFHPIDLIGCDVPGCANPAELDDLLEDDDGPIPYLLCDEHTIAWLRRPRV